MIPDPGPALGTALAATLGLVPAAAAAVLWRRERRRRAAATALAAAAQHRLAGLGDATREALTAYDRDHRPLLANPAFERLTGYTFEELVNQPFLGYVHEEDRAELLERWSSLTQSGGVVEAEYRIVTRRGQVRWCSGRWRTRLDPDGRTDGWSGAEVDVTERRKADEGLRRDAALFQTIVEAQQAVTAAGLDTDAVMAAIVERSRTLTGADGASIEEVAGDELVVRARSGLVAEQPRLADGLSGLCVRSGEPVRSDDAMDDRRVDREVYMPLGVRSLLVLPLVREGRVRLLLKVVSCEPNAFGEREERALRLVGGVMGAAVGHAAVFEARQARLEERTRALQESEQRFKQLVDAAQEGIWVLDDRGVTAYVNHRMAELLGHPLGDVLGRSLVDFLDVAARPEAQRAIAAGAPARHDLRFRRKDGGELWTITTTSPILGRDGAFVGTVAMVTDITERKRAEDQLRRSAERLRTLHEIDQAVLAARSPGEIARAALARLRRLVPCQRCSVTLFDFEQEQVQVVAGFTGGLPLAALPIPIGAFSSNETLRRGVIRYVEDIASLEERPPLFEQLLTEGVRSLLTVPLLVDGEPIGELNLGLAEAGGIEPEHRDIAVEVAAPLAIAIQHARLRDELRRRSADFERRLAERNGELRHAERELETLAHAVAHDFRAPLRHVGGFAQLLLDEHGRRIDEGARHYAERIRDGARELGGLMDALLQLVRVGHQDLIRRPTDLGILLEEARLELQPEWDDRHVDWTIDRLPVVDCDPALARLAVRELLANALKFTRGRPRTCIRIAPIGTDGLAGLAVQDNGVGFRMAYADRVFAPFQRLHRPEEYEGAGVGLALVRRIAERHGGRAWTEARPDEGATFHLLLGPEAARP